MRHFTDCEILEELQNDYLKKTDKENKGADKENKGANWLNFYNSMKAQN